MRTGATVIRFGARSSMRSLEAHRGNSDWLRCAQLDEEFSRCTGATVIRLGVRSESGWRVLPRSALRGLASTTVITAQVVEFVFVANSARTTLTTALVVEFVFSLCALPVREPNLAPAPK